MAPSLEQGKEDTGHWPQRADLIPLEKALTKPLLVWTWAWLGSAMSLEDSVAPQVMGLCICLVLSGSGGASRRHEA